MRTFNSLSEYLNKAIKIRMDKREVLTDQAQDTQKGIQKRHGVYPNDTNWERLKPATIKRKKRGDKPLLETGDLKDSYRKTILDNEAKVSSQNPKAVWMEYGVPSNNIPARPVVLPESKLADDQFKNKVINQLERKFNTL